MVEKSLETISLREHFETRLKASTDSIEGKIKSLVEHGDKLDEERDRARKIALIELERRLDDLNHAHQRAADVLATYVSREVWDKYRDDDMEWKRNEEVTRAVWVTQAEFRTYKETTQNALTLAMGKAQGIGSVWGAIAIVFSIMSAIGTVVTAITVFLRHS